MGAPGGRNRTRHHHGRRRGTFPRPRRNRPRPGRRRPNRSERRHREQDWDVRKGRRGERKRGPFLRGGSDQHNRYDPRLRSENPHRGALAAGGLASGRAPDRPEREPGEESRVRRHAGKVHYGNHYRARDPEAVPTPDDPRDTAVCEKETANEETVGGYLLRAIPVRPAACSLSRRGLDPSCWMTARWSTSGSSRRTPTRWPTAWSAWRTGRSSTKNGNSCRSPRRCLWPSPVSSEPAETGPPNARRSLSPRSSATDGTCCTPRWWNSRNVGCEGRSGPRIIFGKPSAHSTSCSRKRTSSWSGCGSGMDSISRSWPPSSTRGRTSISSRCTGSEIACRSTAGKASGRTYPNARRPSSRRSRASRSLSKASEKRSSRTSSDPFEKSRRTFPSSPVRSSPRVSSPSPGASRNWRAPLRKRFKGPAASPRESGVMGAGGDPRAKGQPVRRGRRRALPDPQYPDVETGEARRSEGEARGGRPVRRAKAVDRPSRDAQGPRPDDRQTQSPSPVDARKRRAVDGPRDVRDVRAPGDSGVPGQDRAGRGDHVPRGARPPQAVVPVTGVDLK